jgi:UDP-N-acetylmuramoyl-L-alanyl-D-glutamate--2,6-diaminopimelate ligase
MHNDTAAVGPSGVPLAAVAAALAEAPIATSGDLSVIVKDVHHDSRSSGVGSLFVAVPGSKADGHEFAGTAVDRGSVALIVERPQDLGVPQLVVRDARRTLGPAAAEVHGHPDQRLALVGVTGTNGKTSVTYLLESIVEAAGDTFGLVGTIGAKVAGRPVPVARTTPEASDLIRLLAEMVDAGVSTAAIEVSSHAMELGRVDGVRFRIAGFTNLSQDHLDFHGTMEQYYDAKRSLFVASRADRGVIWTDDPAGRRLASEVTIATTTVGTSDDSDVRVERRSADLQGVAFDLVTPVGRLSLRVNQPGSFTVDNAAVAATCALELAIAPEAISRGLVAAVPPPGRMTRIDGPGFPVFIDYAHTPDAIATVIDVVRRAGAGRVIALAGAGGNRDRSKRPLMGRALATADLAVVTSDNPRSEDPATIIAEVASGAGEATVAVEPDRRLAIREALATAAPGDVVLVLGKGHEQGQEFEDGRVVPFDDASVVRQELAHLAKSLEAT